MSLSVLGKNGSKRLILRRRRRRGSQKDKSPVSKRSLSQGDHRISKVTAQTKRGVGKETDRQSGAEKVIARKEGVGALPQRPSVPNRLSLVFFCRKRTSVDLGKILGVSRQRKEKQGNERTFVLKILFGEGPL